MTTLDSAQSACSLLWKDRNVEASTKIPDIGRRLLLAQYLEDEFGIAMSDLKVVEAETVGDICSIADECLAAVATPETPDDDEDEEGDAADR